MTKYDELKGLTVRNNGAVLKRLLNEKYGVPMAPRHIGNFVFEAVTSAGDLLTIYTEPVGEDYSEIKITDVKESLVDFFEKLVSRFGIETLETRNSDSLDFCEVSVWGLKEILTAAYEHGKAAGRAEK